MWKFERGGGAGVCFKVMVVHYIGERLRSVASYLELELAHNGSRLSTC